MQIAKTSNQHTNHKQDYLLLGACIISTLFILSIIWRLAVYYIRPTKNILDFVSSGAADVAAPEIDTPLYCISWMAVLLAFVGYYFLNTFLNKYMDTAIKQMMSRMMFILSIIALLVLHSLYLIALIAGVTDPPAADVIIIMISYMAAVIATITICRYAQIKHRQLRTWPTSSIIILLVAVTGIIVIKSIFTQLPLLSLDRIQQYLKSALWLSTFDFSWIRFVLTFISIAFVIVLVVLEDRYPVSRRWLQLPVDILVVSAIIYAVFNMNFFTYDANFYIGPVYDVMHGKALLVNNYSQYGLLSIYGLSFLFTVSGIPLTYGNFFLLLNLVTIAGYIFIYLVLLRGWLKSVSVSVIGIYMIVLWNYFGGHFYTYLSPIFLQVGFLRFGWWLPVIILLLIRIVFIQSGSRASLRKSLNIVEFAVVAVAFFWAFDSGIYVLGAYVATLFVEAFYSSSDFKEKLRSFLRQLMKLTGFLLLTFILISIVTFMAVHRWPDWYGFIRDTIIYSALGLMMLPMPATGIQVLFIGVYVFSVVYIMVKMFLTNSKTQTDLPVLAFITAYGILQFLYYVGRSEAFRFQNVVIPLIIIICWFALKATKVIWTQQGMACLKRNVVAVSATLLVTVVLISVPVQVLTYNAARIVVNRGDAIKLITERNDPDKWIPQNMPPEGFQKSIRAILEKEDDQKDVAIISYWDTYFLINTGKTNILDSNNLLSPLNQSQLDHLAAQILSAKPRSVYIDWNQGHGSITYAQYLKDKIAGTYYLAENVGYLDRYVLRWKYRIKE